LLAAFSVLGHLTLVIYHSLEHPIHGLGQGEVKLLEHVHHPSAWEGGGFTAHFHSDLGVFFIPS
jgi:hypothetical protein